MIESIIVKILEMVAAWCLTRLLEYKRQRDQTAETNKDIDRRLTILKTVFMEVSHDKTVTPDERAKIKDAMRDFVRNSQSGGM